MGLFDKKKPNDDFDSPVERVSLDAPAPAPKPAAEAAPAAPKAEKLPDIEPPEYGIDRAIELMRLLPKDNLELVVQVVKKTLESTNVKIGQIIKDGNRKLSDIEGRIKVLKEEIAEFEKEIQTRKDEITSLEADHKETSEVKESLMLAEKLADKAPPPASAAGIVKK